MGILMLTIYGQSRVQFNVFEGAEITTKLEHDDLISTVKRRMQSDKFIMRLSDRRMTVPQFGVAERIRCRYDEAI